MSAAPPAVRSRVTVNAVANLVGKLWSTALGLGVIPLYVKFLGVEAYGLVGVFASLQAVMGLLDLGMQPTVSRELARLSALDPAEAAGPMRDLVRTFGVVFVGVGLVSGGVVLLASPLLATRWIHAEHLPADTVVRAVGAMGLVLALQWPSSLFFGALMSLQKQVRANQITILIGTLRSLGALAVVRFVSPTIEAFFLTQALASAGQTALGAAALLRSLPPGGPGRFRLQVLRANWRFAAGMLSISVLSVILTQVDKVIVTGTLGLRQVGYYSLATAVASALLNLVAPIAAACAPRLVQLATGGDQTALSDFYHRSCQVVAAVVVPPAITISACARSVLLAWTGRPDTAANAHAALSLLALGTCCNGLMNLPVSLQVAHGWTRLIVSVNAVAVLVLIPLDSFGARRWGAQGAALGWLVLNASYLAVVIRLMHRRLLPGEERRWYAQSLFAPVAPSAAAGLVARAIPTPTSRAGALALVAGVYLVAASGTAMATPASRAMALSFVRRWARRP